ncbi:cob(I)yrinic acid a,c-diamide adenosyltransferase [bacterium]|nr:cob(I)yrinic acid a,c-diamide adenosyltransferase [bacterium]
MTIYTKKGDHGKTNLAGGEQISKDHPLLKACGDLDELNTVLGLLISALPVSLQETMMDLQTLQLCLISIGTRLASVHPQADGICEIAKMPWNTKDIEARIDQMQSELPDCHEFILPGGHESACRAHLARTICRRAERHIVGLTDIKDIRNPYLNVLPFINRLSDYLFVLARYCNFKTNTEELKARSKNPQGK